MGLDHFFEQLWLQYVSVTPQALRIHALLRAQGEVVNNDHVAFRTFAQSPIDIAHLEPIILAMGYEHFSDYHFEQKKLFAKSYCHPNRIEKLFVSELLWDQLDAVCSNIIETLLARISLDSFDEKILMSGRHWPLPSINEYKKLLTYSEYAAWLSIWGLRANHFTLYVNSLTGYDNLSDFLIFLKKNNFPLNVEGGEIKGQVSDLLMQSSTMADEQAVVFSDDNSQRITTCYYEFAQRFEDETGELYKGFVPASANKIFESTHMRGRK